MLDIKPSLLLEDSKNNRFFFYYRDSSIYYRELTNTGDTKDTILISQANADFIGTIDTDDTIYIICNSRYKGVLLFTYTNRGWKFETVVNLHNSTNIFLMDIIVQSGSIHVFFSKKLPIANMYNVYHIYKSMNEQAPYIDYSWRKNSLSEIYSQSIENSYSILPVKGGIIHYASVWYDGTNYYINYYCYDESTKAWIQKNLNMTYRSQVIIRLLYSNKRINLLCFSVENEASNIHHFSSRSSGAGEIDFKEAASTFIDTNGAVPQFYTDDKVLQLTWIKNSIFHQYNYEDSTGKWKKAIDLPVTNELNIGLIRVIKNIGAVSAMQGYFILDSNYNLTRPIEYINKHTPEVKPKEKQQSATLSAALPAIPQDTNDYLKQILDEVKELSANMQHLNKRMDSLEGRTFVQKNVSAEERELPAAWVRPTDNDNSKGFPLKKSNFKEKFLKSQKAPDYDSLLLKQDNITTYVGKPNNTAAEAQKAGEVGIAANDNDKLAFTAPVRHSSFLKKLGEFFK